MEQSDTSNFTHVEDDPFASLDIGSSTVSYSLNILSLVAAILKLLVSLANLFSVSLLVHVLRKFRRLRSRAHSYLLHYAIANLAYNLFAPLYELADALILRLAKGRLTFCIVYQVETCCLFLNFMFGALLAVEWYIKVFRTSNLWVQRHLLLKAWMIPLLYALASIKLFVNTILCVHQEQYYSNALLNVAYFLLLLFIAIVNYVKYQNKMSRTDAEIEANYLIVVATWIIVSWLPLFIVHHLYEFAYNRSRTLIIVLAFIDFIPEIIAYGSPIVVMYLLACYNKYFRMSFEVALKRGRKDYNYEDDLDHGSEDDADTSRRSNPARLEDNFAINTDQIS